MYKKLIPCLYFPTTRVTVDDEKRFLDNLCFQLDSQERFKSFHHPESALQFLNQEYQPAVVAANWKFQLGSEPDFQNYVREFDVNIWRIQEEIYNPQRFKQVAVVIADYGMPNMNGIAFFENLKDSSFKRILLTGKACEKIAIKAFNAGIIHRFIRKDDPHYLQELEAAITELEAEYFQNMSEITLAYLKNNCRYRTCCLDNPCFIDFFNVFLKQYMPTEFYLAGPTGSFIFLDKMGQWRWLVVKDSAQMQFYTEIAYEKSLFVRQALQTRQFVPYFHQHRDNYPAVWDDYLYPATKVSGEVTDYYVACIDVPSDKLLSTSS